MQVWLEVVSTTQQHPFKLASIQEEIPTEWAPLFSLRGKFQNAHRIVWLRTQDKEKHELKEDA